MSDEQADQPPKTPLPVLPSSDKVEQLRQEPPPARPAESSLISRAIDPTKTPRQKALEEKIIDALRTVYDPEIPVNIYELGLIYQINVDEAGVVLVKMTLTAPGCPVAGTLPMEVQTKIEAVPGVTDATVELVWEPPWDKTRMSEAALLELGLI
jgi:FeS assembly SUF system protein